MRLSLSLFAGVAAAFGLFLLMQSLIADREAGLEDSERGAIIDFVRLQPDELVARKQRSRPEPPPPPTRRPPPPKLSISEVQQPTPRQIDIVTPRIEIPAVAGSGPYLGGFTANPSVAESDIIPIVRIAPRYPRQARIRGAEGWVRVRFMINEDGSVSDAQVVEAQPRRLFNREAVRAILRWKFKPRIVDGVAVKREAEQIIEFKMDTG